jgi:inosine-uridine nucleoside N-ribohydrolase
MRYPLVPSDDPVFVFTDPGIDDALALAMAARWKKPKLIGACGVDGNVPARRTSGNLAGLLKLFRAPDLPVFRSEVNDPVHEYATEVHGKNGVGNIKLVRPPLRKRQNLADFLRMQGRFQILSLGPLTSVSGLLREAPDLAAQISRCVIMGGGFQRGNVTPFAEFNIYCNPEAAEEVFRSRLAKVLVPLDVTERVILCPEDLAKLKKSGRGQATKALVGMLEFYFDFERRKNDFVGGYMHDPSAAVALTHPQLFKFRKVGVSVDISRGDSRGGTTISGSSADTWVALEAEENAVRSVIMKGLMDREE